MWGLAAKGWAILALGLVLSGCANTDLSVRSIPADPYAYRPSPAQSLGIPSSRPMPAEADAAVTPAGYISFCLRMPEQCQVKPDAPSSITMTLAVWQVLEKVNSDINSSIWPEDDVRHYGRAEFWTIPTDGYGDCEDYALAKRKTLIEAGLSTAALRIAVVIAPDQGRHAVLTVVTDQGDYVLDNMRENIVPWDQSNYVWIERQDPAKQLAWDSLRAPVLNLASNSEPIVTGDAR